ncbi:MAG TPA: RelA/SpoT family protein [Candidatus Absconditabacterales bacterium]|nr:RelA/SpoT family protein [Candidatus Absconditabacterales bacterium]
MDVKELEKFFDYKPFIDQDPQIILDTILYEAKKYLPADQISGIQRAYEYAAEKHQGQFRLSGELYIVHPLRATVFLMEIKPDLQTIQTCLLHDVIEDCNVSELDIEKVFGAEVAGLCEGMVKVSKIKYKGEDRHLETLKKTFLAMARDLRVIFVKLADRVHNIQTLYYHPNPVKRQKIAQETMKIFVPIAKRLGLYHYQLYLENGSFKVLEEEAFIDIFAYLKKYFGDGEKYTERGIKTLTTMLTKEGIEHFEVKGRIKSPYRIFEKLQNRYKTTEISTVMDLLAYRVITQTVSDCYMVLGIIHKYYTPLIKKIKDYIAVQKFNGYQSIHTTVLGMFRFPTEIQIRTHEMDEVAEFGVAAHFAYTEHNAPVKVSQQQGDWIKKLQTVVNDYTTLDDKEQFKKDLNIEIFEKRIFLYTPQGDVVELPAGSTVLDFAFAVHSNIGLSFKNAIVNGEIKPISYIPQTGDVIKINTFKNKYSANKHRLEFLHTSGAKNNMTKFLKGQQKEQLIVQALQELNHHLKNFGLPLFYSSADLINKKYSKEEIEKKLLAILDKKENYSQLIKSVYPKEVLAYQTHAHMGAKITQNDPHEHTSTLPVVVDGDTLINYYFCPECQPKPGEKIIAKTGKDGIKIHAVHCKGIKTISFDKLLEAHRLGESDNIYKIWLEFSMSSKSGKLMAMMKLFSELHIPVLQVTMKNLQENMSLVAFETEFSNPGKIAFLLNSLKRSDDSLKVVKKNIT